MKLSDILNEEEFASPTDLIDHMSADNQDENREVGDEARDLTHKDKAKILKIGRGTNFKKAMQIVANARTDARLADAENEDTPHTTGGNYDTASNMRLT